MIHGHRLHTHRGSNIPSSVIYSFSVLHDPRSGGSASSNISLLDNQYINLHILTLFRF